MFSLLTAVLPFYFVPTTNTGGGARTDSATNLNAQLGATNPDSENIALSSLLPLDSDGEIQIKPNQQWLAWATDRGMEAMASMAFPGYGCLGDH